MTQPIQKIVKNYYYILFFYFNFILMNQSDEEIKLRRELNDCRSKISVLNDFINTLIHKYITYFHVYIFPHNTDTLHHPTF